MITENIINLLIIGETLSIAGAIFYLVDTYDQ